MHLKFPPRIGSPTPGDVAEAVEFWAANHLLNFQHGKPRVTPELLHRGQVKAFASVLYDPEDEFFHDATPIPGAFDHLMIQLQEVEAALAADPLIVLAKSPQKLEQVLNDPSKVAAFHCVEGALALGGNPDNVVPLAGAGVAYVIVAHLFYRGVATCENAFPGLPQLLFNLVNPQPDGKGLTGRGPQIVEELFRNWILVDITHASDLAQNQIIDIWRGSFRDRPIISSHNSVRRAADHSLNLSDEAVTAIRDSGGVVGVIMSEHWLEPAHSNRGDINSVFRTIRAIQDIAGTDECIAIGSDLDGFIQPIDEYSDESKAQSFADSIAKQYGDESAERMLWKNALRTLKAGWKGAP